jgi:hypothetical protein
LAACQCVNCQAIDRQEASPMGSILHFVNQLARVLPDQIITTLAYTYTRRPPQSLRPAPNVGIQLCTIECQRKQAARPIATDPDHADFRDDLRRWSDLCAHLIIWDYVIQFESLVSPFPNLRTLQPNIRFFVAQGAEGIFSQGNREVGGEFSELRAYLLAKLLWNPECDVEAVMDDFLLGYYGAAGGPIRKYIDLLHDAIGQPGPRLSMDGRPAAHRDGYLSPTMLARYDALFDEAERLVAAAPDLLLRTRTARLPLMFAQLELGYGEVAARRHIADQFFELARQTGLRMVSEVGLTLEKYEARVRAALARDSRAQPTARPADGSPPS